MILYPNPLTMLWNLPGGCETNTKNPHLYCFYLSILYTPGALQLFQFSAALPIVRPDFC